MPEQRETLRIARILERSCANGPGERFVIWLQGCPLRCPGCFNRELWPARGGELVAAAELAKRINARRDIRGITLSGGEPLEQAEAVLELLDDLDERLDRALFTGRTMEEIAADPAKMRVLERVDLVIAGRYRRDLASDENPWAGSSNKEVRELTGRIRAGESPDCRVEINISREAVLTITGFPPEEVTSPSEWSGAQPYFLPKSITISPSASEP